MRGSKGLSVYSLPAVQLLPYSSLARTGRAGLAVAGHQDPHLGSWRLGLSQDGGSVPQAGSYSEMRDLVGTAYGWTVPQGLS